MGEEREKESRGGGGGESGKQESEREGKAKIVFLFLLSPYLLCPETKYNRVDPFAPDAPIKSVAIETFPPDVFFVLRVIQVRRDGSERESGLLEGEFFPFPLFFLRFFTHLIDRPTHTKRH